MAKKNAPHDYEKELLATRLLAWEAAEILGEIVGHIANGELFDECRVADAYEIVRSVAKGEAAEW
jgi:hypothetical protein